MITVMSPAVILLAGNCNDHQQVTMADSKPVLLLQICDMKLMKYTNVEIVLCGVKIIVAKPLRNIWTVNSKLHVSQKWLKILKFKTLGIFTVSRLIPL